MRKASSALMPNWFVPFRYNNLGREGAAALAPALQAMLRLTSLDLGLVHFLHANNNIGTDAQTRLCHSGATISATREQRHLLRLCKPCPG
jgi:hypothetical protein